MDDATIVLILCFLGGLVGFGLRAIITYRRFRRRTEQLEIERIKRKEKLYNYASGAIEDDETREGL